MRTLARAILSLYAAVLASRLREIPTAFPRVELVPNGVNTDKFSAIDRTRSSGFLNWIYWGTFSRNQSIDCVIAYAAAARKRGFDVRLTICGTDFDDLLPALRELSAGDHALLDALLSQLAEAFSVISTRNREAARRFSWHHAQQAFERVYRTVLAAS